MRLEMPPRRSRPWLLPVVHRAELNSSIPIVILRYITARYHGCQAQSFSRPVGSFAATHPLVSERFLSLPAADADAAHRQESGGQGQGSGAKKGDTRHGKAHSAGGSRKRRRLPIYLSSVVTATGQVSDTEDVLTNSPDDFVGKPVDLVNLRARIGAMLRARRDHQGARSGVPKTQSGRCACAKGGSVGTLPRNYDDE